MSEIFNPEHVALGVEVSTKVEALKLLAAEAIRLGLAEDEQAVLAAYDAREEEGATGLIEGFSIPHAKTAAITRAGVLVQTFAQPVDDWETLDASKVTCAISLLIPEAEAGSTHIKLLSKVAVMIMDEDFRESFRNATSAQEIADLIDIRLTAE